MKTLTHYGIKGMKWGVRRYQNYDGTLTEAGKVRQTAGRIYRNVDKTRNDVQSIVDTMSAKERYFLGGDPNRPYMLDNEVKEVGKRFIKRVENVPVAFLDIYYASNGAGSIALGTRSDARGKGYASELVERGKQWLDTPQAKDILEINTLNWFARRENQPSINLAKKHGFVERKDYKSDTEWWGGRYRKLKRKDF